MKVEINKPLTLSTEQTFLLDNHSLLNILTILVSEIELSGMLAGGEEIAKPLAEKSLQLKSMLTRPVSGKTDFQKLHAFRENAVRVFDRLIPMKAADEQITDALRESLKNVLRILDIFETRVQELLIRSDNPDEWIKMPISKLESNFSNVLTAIAKNSKGKYNIVQNIARKTNYDYMVNLSIESESGEFIYMPAVMQDCLRDIIANARKYTKPGGNIIAGLYNNDRTLKMVVSDDGCGIPESEIDKVVEFGYRASNVLSRPTKGGGFGLTKAYHVAKRFNGRMWIESEVGNGTTITIEIPVPEKYRTTNTVKENEAVL